MCWKDPQDYYPLNTGHMLLRITIPQTATYSDKIILYWHQHQFKCTIPLDIQDTNVVTIFTAPGYTRYHAFCANISHKDDDETKYACKTNVVSNDEAQESSESQDEQSDNDLHFPQSIPLVTNRF